MGTLFHAEWFAVPFIEWIHSVSYMRFYLNRGGVPRFPTVLCSLSQGFAPMHVILNGTLNCHYVYESELVALLCCHDIYIVNTNRAQDTLTPPHLCLIRLRPRGLIFAIWDEHTLLFSLARRQGKLHHSWATQLFSGLYDCLALRCYVQQWWAWIETAGRNSVEGLCIRVWTRHFDILVRMFHFRRILVHCNDRLLIVNTMLFLRSLSYLNLDFQVKTWHGVSSLHWFHRLFQWSAHFLSES